MKNNQSNSYVWLVGVAFALMFFIRKCIGEHRHKTEVVPILNGMREQAVREGAVVYGKTGIIYTLSNRDSINVSYVFYNGYKRANKDSLDFHIIYAKMPNGGAYTSRDTTTGQVTSMLFKKPLDSLYYNTDKRDVKGVKFLPNSSKFNDKNFSLRTIGIYLNDSTDVCFIADTFTKDSTSHHHTLAKNRLITIKKKMAQLNIDTSKFKLKAHNKPSYLEALMQKFKVNEKQTATNNEY